MKNESAFPIQSVYIENQESNSRGMTLRDYFAAKAMQEWVGACDPKEGAIRAYEWADAMLKARDGNS